MDKIYITVDPDADEELISAEKTIGFIIKDLNSCPITLLKKLKMNNRIDYRGSVIRYEGEYPLYWEKYLCL